MRKKDIHDPFLLEKKITTYELRKNSRKEMGPTFINAKGKDCTSIDYILFQEGYREQISNIKKIDVIANVS